MKRTIGLIFFCAFVLSSCKFQQLMKSTDNVMKYEKAKEYYAKGDYLRAYTLLEDISPAYKGTPEGEDVLHMIADSYFKNKNYQTAINYYNAYNNNFPTGKYTADCHFMIGYCYYKQSADARLDQTETYSALNALRLYLEKYPFDSRTSEAAQLVEELENKLAYKELLNARLYYKLGNYIGNNYLSAIIVAQNAVKNYPFNLYREEFAFIVLKSKFMQAEKSILDKKEDRYRDTIDEYYVYSAEFPDGKNKKEAEHIFNISKKHINE